MEKLFRILVMVSACMPAMLFAQDDGKYLAGGVPETDGKVVFKKEYHLEGADRNAIYERVCEWLDERMKANGNSSRIAYMNKEEGQVVAQGEEYLVFGSNAFSLDRALMNYNVVALCEPGKCEIRIERIRYKYEDERFTAEERISDEIALNKKKTAIFRGNKKFRVHTVDFADKLFDDTGTAFGLRNAAPVSRPAVSPAPQAADVTPVAEIVPASPAGVQASSGISDAPRGYKQLAPDKIPGNIIKMLGEDWMLITAGTDAQFNMMTASWGGLGVLYGKPVAICFINPARYTYQLMEKNDTYTLTFYTEAYREALKYCGSNSGRDMDKVKGSGLTPITVPSGGKAFSEAWLIVECRKLVGQSLSPDALFDENVKSDWAGKQLHKMYIGEIVNVWVK
jgi:flavin reductase (DIM6/NTAB) family NADH-FMN oxidoreductase RutF